MARKHRKVNVCQLRGGKLAHVAKDGQRDTMHTTLRYINNNVTQFTVTQMQLSNHMTYLLIITLAHSPIPSQIPHTLFDIITLGVDAV